VKGKKSGDRLNLQSNQAPTQVHNQRPSGEKKRPEWKRFSDAHSTRNQ